MKTKQGATLLWSNATAEHAKAADECGYAFIGSQRILCWAKPGTVNGFLQADDAIAASLNEAETQWLQETITASARERAEKNRKAARENDRSFMTAFERELEAERRRMADGPKDTQ